MFDGCKGHDVAVYAGYLNDKEKLLQSSSGGIATALAEHMVAQGGYVAGVSYSKDFYRAEYILIHDLADIGRLKGSKYIECDKNNIYSNIKALLAAGENVLFFGLPCATAALYSFLGSRPQNLLTCELVCHGSTSAKVHEDYVAHLEQKYKGKITDFSVRHKKGSWTPSYLYARFSNGKIFEKQFTETEYGYAFYALKKTACYHCKFKDNNRQGDIMIGDFWGAAENDAFWNQYGISCVFAETNAGNAFVQAVPGISLFPTTFEKVVEGNPMVIRSVTKSANCDKLAALLKETDLLYAVRHTAGLPVRIKIAAAGYIPNCIKPFVKKIYHVIVKRIS